MTSDVIFMAKSGSAVAPQIQDQELFEHLKIYHEDDLTTLLLTLEDVGGIPVGELAIPDVAMEEQIND